MFKNLSGIWLMSSLLIAGLCSPPSAFAQSPSKGPAGNTSGSTPTAGSETNFGVPATGSTLGTPSFQSVNTNITTTTSPSGQVTVTAPPAITQAVTTAGTTLANTFSAGTSSQQQTAALLSSPTTVVNSTEATVSGQIVIESNQGGQTVTTETYTTMGQAFDALNTGVNTSSSDTSFTMEVNGVEVTINSPQ